MSRPCPRALLVLLCAVLCAVVLAACGDDPDDGDGVARASSATVDRVLEETFGDGPGATRSGRLDVDLRFAPEGMRGLDGPVKLVLEGPFSGDGDGLPAFDFELGGAIAGAPVDAGAVSTGEKGYLRLRGKAYELPGEIVDQLKRSFEHAGDEDEQADKGPTFESLGIDPRRWLTRARIAGTEEVGGAETIHVTGGIDAARLLEDVDTLLGKAGELGVLAPGEAPVDLSAKDRRLIAGAVRRAEVDIWTGERDRHLRRLAVDLDFAVPEAARDAVGGLREGTLKLDLLIAALNEEQEISEPDGARPLADLLGPGLGALLGGAGAPGGSGAPGVGAGSAYLDCLQRAGDRIAEIQKCASDLTR